MLRADICLYSFVPFGKAGESSEREPQTSEQTATVIRIKTVNDSLWKAISDWVNEDTMKPDALVQFKERVCLIRSLPFES